MVSYQTLTHFWLWTVTDVVDQVAKKDLDAGLQGGRKGDENGWNELKSIQFEG